MPLESNNTINVDTFTKGIVYVNGISGGTWPWETGLAYMSLLIAVPRNDYGRVLQVVMRESKGIYMRTKTDDTWGAWSKLA